MALLDNETNVWGQIQKIFEQPRTRRQFLKGLGVVGAAALLSACASKVEPQPTPPPFDMDKFYSVPLPDLHWEGMGTNNYLFRIVNETGYEARLRMEMDKTNPTI